MNESCAALPWRGLTAEIVGYNTKIGLLYGKCADNSREPSSG